MQRVVRLLPVGFCSLSPPLDLQSPLFVWLSWAVALWKVHRGESFCHVFAFLVFGWSHDTFAGISSYLLFFSFFLHSAAYPPTPTLPCSETLWHCPSPPQGELQPELAWGHPDERLHMWEGLREEPLIPLFSAVSATSRHCLPLVSRDLAVHPAVLGRDWGGGAFGGVRLSGSQLQLLVCMSLLERNRRDLLSVDFGFFFLIMRNSDDTHR